ncbi:MAG: hypothetical protein Q4F34_07065 [Prevotellaceae bacterium]|nr:hypothetical protein [Prevotellaceae bacterium]
MKKKSYIKPNTNVVGVEASSIICESSGGSEDNQENPNIDPYSH